MSPLVAALKNNPVLVQDACKYGMVILVMFGLPIPPGFDYAVSGVVFGLLSLLTRSMVTPMSGLLLAEYDSNTFGQ